MATWSGASWLPSVLIPRIYVYAHITTDYATRGARYETGLLEIGANKTVGVHKWQCVRFRAGRGSTSVVCDTEREGGGGRNRERAGAGGGGGGGQRERERERNREVGGRERDRWTQRQRGTKTERERDTQRGRRPGGGGAEREGRAEKETDGYRDRDRERVWFLCLVLMWTSAIHKTVHSR